MNSARPRLGHAAQSQMIAGGEITLEAGQGTRLFGLALFPTVIADGEITQAGHDARPVGVADGAAILVPVPIAHPVESVFDGPVSTGQAVKSCFVGSLGFQAGEQKDRFLMDRASPSVGPTVQAHGLGGEGEVDFGPVELAADHSTFFEPAVGLFNLGASRGKKRSAAAGVGASGGGWAGCL